MDSFRLKQAAQFVAEGRDEEAPQLSNAKTPSITSARTLLDLANMGVLLTDFYGVLEATLKRYSAGPSRVTTALIQNADHMYGGAEAQVAQTLARWMDDVVTKKP